MEHKDEHRLELEQEVNEYRDIQDEHPDVLLGELGTRAVSVVSTTVLELIERSETIGPKMRRGSEDRAVLFAWMDEERVQLLPMPDEALSTAIGFEWCGEYRFDVYLWTIDHQPSELQLRLTLIPAVDGFEVIVDGLLWT